MGDPRIVMACSCGWPLKTLLVTGPKNVEGFCECGTRYDLESVGEGWIVRAEIVPDEKQPDIEFSRDVETAFDLKRYRFDVRNREGGLAVVRIAFSSELRVAEIRPSGEADSRFESVDSVTKARRLWIRSLKPLVRPRAVRTPSR